MLVAVLAIVATACNKEDKPIEVTVALQLDNQPYAEAGVTVTLGDYTATTDASGAAVFTVPVGVYDASASFKKVVDTKVQLFNGKQNCIVAQGAEAQKFVIELSVSESNQIIIKEIYAGGCMDNDGAKNYAYDKYIILYNNSSLEADASQLCFGTPYPYNAHGTNKFLVDGKLSYTDKMPLGCNFWAFKTTVKIAPYSQIVIAVTGAIDHTATYSKSVDLSNADYCCYDPESGLNLASNYPAPSTTIPATNYLKAYKFATGTAWPLSMSTPGIVLFKMTAAEAEAAVATEALDYTAGAKLPCAMVPVANIVDGVEVFNIPNVAKSTSRFLASVDAGNALFVEKNGYSIYRNVDKEATEALEENAGKLVYSYAGGTETIEGGTTDPSGIDAEASIAAGAHIIYMDTNNSTNDFHMRAKASIKK